MVPPVALNSKWRCRERSTALASVGGALKGKMSQRLSETQLLLHLVHGSVPSFSQGDLTAKQKLLLLAL